MKRPSFVALATCLLFLLAFYVLPAFAQATTQRTNDDKFGKLPANPVSTWELSGVRGEIAIDHFLDPAVFKERLPQGFRPLTVGEAGPELAKWVESNPKYSSYYVATLVFSSMETWVVDSTNIGEGGRAPFAAWWIWGTATPPLDKVALGGVSLQLAAWYPDSGPNRRKLAPDPTIEFAKVELVNTKPGEWRVRLKFKGGEITAECREAGERTEMKYPLPQYSTIFLGGPDTSKYMIYTYYGHHARAIQADWQFAGDHPLIRSLSAMKNIYPTRTMLQDGWVARAGMYKMRK